MHPDELRMTQQAHDFAARVLTNETVKKVQEHDEILVGKHGEPGVAHKVGFMWRVHVWLIGILGTLVGSGVTWFVMIITQSHHG